MKQAVWFGGIDDVVAIGKSLLEGEKRARE